MDIDSKKIFLSIAAFLVAGLFIAIMLSFQVMKDSKVSIRPIFSSSAQVKAETKPESIYGVDIAFSPTQIPPAARAQSAATKTLKKQPAVVPPENIKTYEQEQAELSAGLQQDYGATVNPSSGGSISALSEPAAPSEPATQEPASQPTEQDIQDLQKKGLIIF